MGLIMLWLRTRAARSMHALTRTRVQALRVRVASARARAYRRYSILYPDKSVSVRHGSGRY